LLSILAYDTAVSCQSSLNILVSVTSLHSVIMKLQGRGYNGTERHMLHRWLVVRSSTAKQPSTIIFWRK